MPEDMVNRAKAYLEPGRVEEARADLDEAIKAYPNFALAYVSRGVTWLRSGDPAQALQDLDRAIEIAPDWPLRMTPAVALIPN